MEDDRVVELLRALPPAPEDWVHRAREIPLLAESQAIAEQLDGGSPDEPTVTDDPSALGGDHWDSGWEPDDTSAADDPPGDGWSS